MAIFVPRFVRQLRDVLLTAPADGEVLTYDSADAKWKNEAAAGGSGDLTDAVILAPPSSARNVLQPTAGAVIAAIVKAHAAQSVDLTQWQDSAGVVLSSIDELGAWFIAPSDPDVPAIVIEGVPGTSVRPGLIVDFRPAGFSGAALLCDGNEFQSVDIADTVAWGPGGSFNNLSWASTGVDGQQFVTIQLGPVGSTYVNEWRPDGMYFKDAAAVHLIRVLQDGEVFIAKAGGTLGFLGATPVVQQSASALADLWDALKDYGLLDAGSTAPTVGGAPTTATYITQTPDAGLSAEQALSALATGLVKNTTATGVLSIGAQGTDYWAPGGTDVAVADGGTGSSTAAGARTNLGLVINTDVPGQSTFSAIQFKTARYYQQVGGSIGSGVTVNLNDLHLTPFLVPETTTFDRIGVDVTSAVATSVARLGIYNQTDGYPTTVLLDAGTVATSSGSGLKEITISQQLTPGMYFLAVVGQTAAPTLRVAAVPFHQLGSDGVYSTPLMAYLEAGISGTLATFTSSITKRLTNTPLVYMRAA